MSDKYAMDRIIAFIAYEDAQEIAYSIAEQEGIEEDVELTEKELEKISTRMDNYVGQLFDHLVGVVSDVVQERNT